MFRFTRRLSATRSRFNLASNTRPGARQSTDGYSVLVGTPTSVGFAGDFVRYGTTPDTPMFVVYTEPPCYAGRPGQRLQFSMSVRSSVAADVQLFPYTVSNGTLRNLPTASIVTASSDVVTSLEAARTADRAFDSLAVGIYVAARPGSRLDFGRPLLEPSSSSAVRPFFDGASSLSGHTVSWLGEPFRSASVATPDGWQADSAAALLLLSWDEEMPSRVVELEPPGLPDPVLVEPLGGRMRSRSGTLRVLMSPDQLARLRALAVAGDVCLEDTTDPSRTLAVDVRGISDRHVPGTRVEVREVSVTWREARLT